MDILPFKSFCRTWRRDVLRAGGADKGPSSSVIVNVVGYQKYVRMISGQLQLVSTLVCLGVGCLVDVIVDVVVVVVVVVGVVGVVVAAAAAAAAESLFFPYAGPCFCTNGYQN